MIFDYSMVSLTLPILGNFTIVFISNVVYTML
jgi:hypothetical protein